MLNIKTNRKGSALIGLGNYTGAIKYSDKVLAIDPKDKTALDNKGGGIGNYTGAMTYLDKALAIDPKYKNALTDKGVTLASLGNYTRAVVNFVSECVVPVVNNQNELLGGSKYGKSYRYTHTSA